MEVVAVVLDGAAVINWAATGAQHGFSGTTELHRFKALKRAPAPGIVDHEPAVGSAHKKGEPASISITALDERSVLGGLAQTLQATVTVVIDGTEPYQAEVKQVVVPGYASHLLEVGRTLPGFVSLRRLDKPVIDWAAAANAEPGVGVGPARPRRGSAPEEAAGTPLDDAQGVRAAVDAAAGAGQLIGGIDLATYVAVEVGLQRDRCRPDGHNAYAASFGVPPGTWAQASAAWQAAIRTNWTAAPPSAKRSRPPAGADDRSSPLPTLASERRPPPHRRAASSPCAASVRCASASLGWPSGCSPSSAAHCSCRASRRCRSPRPRAEPGVGDPVTFDADEQASTAITLTPDPLVGQLTEDRIGQLDCAVEHPDGTTEDLNDPSSATVRTSSSVGVFAAALHGRGGPTTVTCTSHGAGASGGSYSVGRTQEAVQIAGIVALVAGVVLLIAGSWAMVVGYRGKPEVQEISPGAR